MSNQTSRIDAYESAFFTSQFGAAAVAVYEKKYPELIGRRLVPVNNTPDLRDVFPYTSSEAVGTARLSAGYTDDAPRVDLVAGPELYGRARVIKNSFGWDVGEMRRARATGEDIYSKKLSAARMAAERTIDKMLLLGYSALGAEGLFTMSNTATHTMPGAFSTLSAADALTELNEFRDAVGVATKGIHDINVIVMPGTVYSRLSSLFITGTSVSVLKYFMEANPQISIERTHMLEAGGAIGANSKMVGYQRSEEVLQAWIPQEFEALDPEIRNFEMVVSCHARVTGVAGFFPKAVVYAADV